MFPFRPNSRGDFRRHLGAFRVSLLASVFLWLAAGTRGQSRSRGVSAAVVTRAPPGICGLVRWGALSPERDQTLAPALPPLTVPPRKLQFLIC